MSSMFSRFINSSTGKISIYIEGPKTIYFWAPMFNWGYVIASLLDKDKKPEQISTRMLISKRLHLNKFL